MEKTHLHKKPEALNIPYIYSLTLFSLIFLTSSCEKLSEYQNIIDNRTNDTISIYLKGTSAYVSGTDTIIALPKKQTTYYIADGWTIRSKNHVCDPQLFSSETTVVLSGGKMLKKDITKKENWNCETDKNNTFWKMIFKINVEDIK